jgi:predicted ribosomally synthesized peptide with nif11-like leader
MAKQEIGRLVEALASNPELRAKLEQSKNEDEMIATARAAGYTFTAEELRQEVQARKQVLTEEQLERVAGGFSWGVSPALNFLPAVQLKILIGL